MAIKEETNKLFEHKGNISSYFSQHKDAWRMNYEVNDSGNISLYKQEVLKRKEIVLALLDKYANENSLNVLDIGCGAGIIMREILKRGHKVIGSDISTEMLSEADKNTSDFSTDMKRFMQGDVENIPFDNKTFDFVTCVGVMEYQVSDESGIGEISRVLKDDGYAIITFPNLLRFKNIIDPYYYLALFPRLLKKLRWKAKPRQYDVVNMVEHNKYFTNRKYYYGQLNSLFRTYNLEILDYVCVGYSPLITIWRKSIMPKAMAVRIGCFLENMASSSRFSILKWIPNRWVICLKKTTS